MVVAVLPSGEVGHGRVEVTPSVPIPELLAIDAMAAFDFAILLRSAGSYVAHADAELLARQRKHQRELGPVSTWILRIWNGNAAVSSRRNARLERWFCSGGRRRLAGPDMDHNTQGPPRRVQSTRPSAVSGTPSSARRARCSAPPGSGLALPSE